MSSLKSLAVLPLAFAAALAVGALAGCSAGTAEPAATESAAPAPVETPTATETVAPATFTLPTTCTTVVPQTRVDAFEASGLELLGGPGGTYGTDYLADATPEETAGGISCIWGFADSGVSSVTISVAPLTAAVRPQVVASFTTQGLNEEVVGDATTFGVQGDRTLDPAIINALRGESWISVIETIGGPTAYAEAVAIADEVHAQVYTAN
jgi:hypothetical protein